MLKEYRVVTDEEFFNKFSELTTRVRLMATLFQNEGIIISQDEVDDWLMDANKLSDMVLELKKEGYYKLEKLFED